MTPKQILESFDIWLTHAFEYPYSALTRKAYRGVAEDLLNCSSELQGFPPEAVDLRAITLEHLGAFVERSANGRRYAASSRIVRMAAMQVFWRFLRERGLVEVNLAVELAKAKKAEQAQAGQGGRKPKRQPSVLAWSEQDALLQFVAQNPFPDVRARDTALIKLLLVTGLRRQECCDLKLTGLNLKDGRLRILGKGNKERIVLFDPTDCGLDSAMADWLPWRNLFATRARIKERGTPETCFLTRTGRPLRANLVYQQVAKYLQSAGLSPGHFGPHVLRHTAASRMLAHNVPLRRVMENMGHEHLATLEIYAHLLEAPPAPDEP